MIKGYIKKFTSHSCGVGLRYTKRDYRWSLKIFNILTRGGNQQEGS
jgi:hypothetical protein